MLHNLKISVITPSYNSAHYIEDAIQSVRKQEYPNFEHIIVDGGSTDGTLEIISKYDHLIWVSEQDSGQSDAMNKGFRMSKGDIIVYLNADDFFLPDAFKRVIPYFNIGAKFVIGKVRVEKNDGNSWINDPKVTHDEMLRHWEKSAFCVNPVGYFYRREVQENVSGFNVDNHLAMDLEFLLDCSLKYELIKIPDNAPLGVFRYHEETKTAQSNMDLSELFSLHTYSFIDKFLINKSPEYIQKYNRLREKGYRDRINPHHKRKKLINKISAFSLYNIKLFRKLKDFRRSHEKMDILRQFIKRNI